MTEEDEIKLRKFFQENKQVIADDGFTDKVMSRLSARRKGGSTIGVGLLMMLSVLIFIGFGGWGLLKDLVVDLIYMVYGLVLHLDAKSLVCIAIVCIYMIFEKIHSIEKQF